MQEAPVTEVDRAALKAVEQAWMKPVEVSIPDWPYDSLNLILFAESAGSLRRLDAQRRGKRTQSAGNRCVAEHLSPVAIPIGSRFRAGRSLPPQDRRGDGARFSHVDLLLVPSLRDEMLVITNFTGHPSLTLRAGFVECRRRGATGAGTAASAPKLSPPRRVPHGVTLIGQLFDEGTLGSAGFALERIFDITEQRPAGF
jgi:Asp-tRNA(Asn)/Glu-tRNA(Gln) amidotransferase A subunit family amidase